MPFRIIIQFQVRLSGKGNETEGKQLHIKNDLAVIPELATQIEVQKEVNGGDTHTCKTLNDDHSNFSPDSPCIVCRS